MDGKVRFLRWDKPDKPNGTQLRQLMQDEGLNPYQWSNGPGDIYAAHSHSYHKVIFVVRGSIDFGLPATGESLSLCPGDRLDLPAGVLHDAEVGTNGVICLEGHGKSKAGDL